MAAKPLITDPKKYFSSWEYNIIPTFWAVLGITRREYINKEKTKKARQKAANEGKNKEYIKKIKVKYFAYARSKQIVYDFHEGDIFYRKQPNDESSGVQISLIRDQIEVYEFTHNRYKSVLRISETQLAEWLKTGIKPAKCQIPVTESWHELSRYIFMDKKQITFKVQGSDSTPYTVTFKRRNGKVTISCTCKAGKHNTCCKHRMALIGGDSSAIVSNNVDEVYNIHHLIAESNIEETVIKIRALEKELEKSKTHLKNLKKQLSRLMNG